MNTKNLFINLTDPAIFQSFGGNEYWERASFLAGQTVFKEGAESRDFYYVFSGNLKVTKSIKDSDGTEKFIANLCAGDFFGEGALLSDKVRAGSVIATADTVLLKLSQEKFEAFLVKDPNAAVGIILGIVKVLNARLQDTNERLVALHNVAKLVRKYQGNMEALTPTVFKEFEEILHHGFLALFTVDGYAKFASAKAGSFELDGIKPFIAKVAENFKSQSGVASYVEGDYLYLPVYNLTGELSGILVSMICPDCKEQDLRLLITLAEQMSHLV
ncbi:MAG: cyclic nucleotide-binding domain-containing protein [Candidatus Gracilibacteria bacterium]